MIDENMFSIYRKEVLKYLTPLNGDHLFDKILTADAFESNKIFLCYPALFADAFGLDIKSQPVKNISTAGYLYFYSLLKIDDLFDAASASIGARVMTFILKSHEESIKILTGYFNGRSAFWKAWDKLHHSYYSNIIFEKQIPDKEVLQDGVYDQLAVARNSIGLIALEAIMHLQTRPQKSNTTNWCRYITISQ